MSGSSVPTQVGVNSQGSPIWRFDAVPNSAPASPLSVNAADYVQAGDGGDFALAINRAIAAIGLTGGGSVLIPPYPMTVQTSIVCAYDNVALIGAGRASQLTAGASFPASAPMIWYQAPASGFREGARVRDLLLVNTAGPTSAIGIQLDSTYYASIERVDVEGAYATSIYLNGSSSYFGAYTVVRDCHIGAVPGGGGSAGTGILSHNHEHWTVDHCTINWFNNAGGVGIKVTSSSCTLHDCHIDECDTGLWLYFCQLTRVIANTFDRGLTRFLYLNGCNMCRILGNDFDTRDGSGTGPDAVLLDNNAADNIIEANNWQTGQAWTNAIHDNANSAHVNYYLNNDLGGLAVVRGQGVYRGNVGYNPLGHSAPQPAVPASGTALTNAGPVDATVYIATVGGLTAVAIGGTAVPGTPAVGSSYRVPVGQTITLTWATTAPTWSWFGD